MTLIDRQNYTGPVIIAPGQSIEEVITVRIRSLWKGNVFSLVFQPVCLFTRGVVPMKFVRWNPPDLFKLVVQLGTPLPHG